MLRTHWELERNIVETTQKNMEKPIRNRCPLEIDALC
jgi:hypothetical protein